MEIGDLMNINELSASFDLQIKYLVSSISTYIVGKPHRIPSPHIYSTLLSSKYTANKLTELSRLVDF